MNLGFWDHNRWSADYVREFHILVDVPIWRRCRLIDRLPIVVRTNRLRDNDDSSCRSRAANLLQQSLQLAGSGLPTLAGGSDVRKFLERIVLRNLVVKNSLRFFVRRVRSHFARTRKRKQEGEQENPGAVQEQRDTQRSAFKPEWCNRSSLEQFDRFAKRVQAYPREQCS